MKMHYSKEVYASMRNRKPRKRHKIKKSTIDDFIAFNVWFIGFICLIILGFTM